MPIAVTSPRSSPTRTLGPNSMLALATVGLRGQLLGLGAAQPAGPAVQGRGCSLSRSSRRCWSRSRWSSARWAASRSARSPTGSAAGSCSRWSRSPRSSRCCTSACPGTPRWPALLVGGFFLGIGGTAFAVGVPFVNAWFPPERRGLAIGVFGAGMGGTAISALTTVKLVTAHGIAHPVPAHRGRASRVYAVRGRAAAARRARPAVVPTQPPCARLAAAARLPITWQASRAVRGRVRRLRRVLASTCRPT